MQQVREYAGWLLLVAGGLLPYASSVWPVLAGCGAADVGCTPVGAADVAPMMVVGALLAIRGWTRLDLPGGFSIRRKLSDVQRNVEEVGEKVELRARLSSAASDNEDDTPVTGRTERLAALAESLRRALSGARGDRPAYLLDQGEELLMTLELAMKYPGLTDDAEVGNLETRLQRVLGHLGAQ